MTWPLDYGEVLLQPGSLFETWAQQAKAPCCVFTAIWLAEVARMSSDGGLPPVVETSDMPWRDAMSNAVRLFGLTWWSRANNWKGESIWSTVTAIPGGMQVVAEIMYKDTAVDHRKMPLRHWAVSQYWDLSTDTNGHTQLYRRNDDGSVTLHHSDDKLGYRTAHKPGHEFFYTPHEVKKRLALGILPQSFTDPRQC